MLGAPKGSSKGGISMATIGELVLDGGMLAQICNLQFDCDLVSQNSISVSATEQPSDIYRKRLLLLDWAISIVRYPVVARLQVGDTWQQWRTADDHISGLNT